ncbi:hypothetical protein BC936DRAFT_141434 [Jimgerdemannia flammicorona]|uniref:Non-specific serine/threonine protein kinase n=1 Tax=Jimgerdemannia flammicorona TaxID=994334 RepID=A0A433DG24_9FUNG|nr:hypothetical protein BC936DRAFT_141434 [Jimgerdemannia flammicorona]
MALTALNVYAHRLSDPGLEIKLKNTIASELRDQVEVYQPEYPRFLSVLIPVFVDLLRNGQPVFISNAPEQKIRNTILEILHRLPHHDPLKEYAVELCSVLMQLLRIENEDNAVVCLKIIIDLHRSYKNVLEDQVQPFLDIVQEIYKNMEQTVKDTFDSPGGTPAAITANTPGTTSLTAASPRPMSPAADVTETPKVLAKSLYSFKVLTECPIIVVLIFQSYRKFANDNIPKFVPLIIEVWQCSRLNTQCLQARPQIEAALAARAKGEIYAGVSSTIKNRAVYTEFIVAQVKTMSFLAYILRSYAFLLRPHQNQIPDFVIRLLRDCPPEASATRKELLVATRHILSTDFRTSFVSKIDILLNEKVLVGTGVTSHDTLRPLAYSMLADLVHHVRAELTPVQLSRTVYIYSRNLHDSTLAPSIQTMCAKLLLNLIDCIVKIPNKVDGRNLLIRILDAFTNKFAALNLCFPSALKQYQKRKLNPDGTPITPAVDDEFDFDRSRSIHTAVFAPDSAHDTIKGAFISWDGRFLFKNLVAGLKGVISGLRNCNPAPPTATPPHTNNTQNYSQFARGFTQDEVDIFLRLFREGVRCFDYYNVDNIGSDVPNGVATNGDKTNSESLTKLGPQSKEEKEVLDLFSIAFTFVDPAVFQEVFASQMGYFFDQMLLNTSLIHIPQFFLANDTLSQGFAGILFRFLVDRLDKLGDSDTLYSSVMLRLFKLAFMAVNLFPDANETILQPYLGNIIMSCLKLSAKAKEPSNYFLLLRALFRSIGGGRFELLYKEVLPLLQVLLENLNSLLTLAHKQNMRELFVELCLTVPVRLSALLPYLPYLMKPLVLALQAGPDLVSQGLRTLELCIDNLTQDFLDPIMAPVINDLMNALWKHLQPLPYNPQHSHAAMRILGKLGGRNRRMLKDPPRLTYATQSESGIDVTVYFDPITSPQVLPLDDCLTLAAKTLRDPNADLFYKEHAWKFLRACVALTLDVDAGPSDLAQSLYERIHRQLLNPASTDSAANTQSENEGTSDKMEVDGVEETIERNETKGAALAGKSPSIVGHGKLVKKRIAQEETLRTILCALFTAASVPELKDEAWSFFENICRHFALLHVGEMAEVKENKGKKSFAERMDVVNTKQYLDTTILVDAIVEVMTSEDMKLRKLAEAALQLFYDTCVTLFGKKESVGQLRIFHNFAVQFCSCCYKQEWFKKSGGCLGISIMSSQLDMGTKWMRDHELDFVRSLLFVLKDSSPEMATVNTADATQTLSHVLKVCNRPEDDESADVQNKFSHLISLLISELSNSNSAVRETIQSSFQLLADLTGNEVTELLAPFRERLVGPIFTKPLRALPFAMQIGHIDAITYCLTLRPPFLEFSDELVRLLHEALALADAEDQALVGRSSQYKNATSLMNLRIVCIKLLSAAMACSDFLNKNQTGTRARIIQVFFKSLYSKSPEVVEAAHRGLKQVLAQQHKLPKDLLQAGLRPILTTLSNYKTLTVAGLEGLARLLELLTNYFKVEIGKKLLDHLKQWADPNVLQEIAGKPLSENHEIKIIVAILNIFHLLPAAANIFLDDLVNVVLEMESHLRRSVSSPFRPNLIKFLNRYPTESVVYFYDRLSDARYSRLFVDILGTESASNLREEVAKSPNELITRTFGATESNNLRFQGILIVRELVQYEPDWLAKQKPVLDCLLSIWRSQGRADRLKKEDTLGVTVLRESQYLMEIFIAYLRTVPSEVDLIFELVTIFAQESVIDCFFLKKFFLDEVALKYSPLQKRAILEKSLNRFPDVSISPTMKMMTLRHVVNPMLLVSVTRGISEYAELLDTAMMEQIHLKIWRQLLAESSDDNQYSEDSLRIELLQMTALIVQYAPQLVTEARKDVIKFGWNFLKLEDVTGKHAAYVLISRFIAAYETPSKIVIQIYAALLRAHQAEARTLVKQGLDILAPVLPKRIANVSNMAEPKYPMWVRLTRKVLVEDGHSVSQLVNVYQLLVRHPDLFFDYREHFLPQIVTTLSKLGLLQSATPETKSLTVDLADLILKWEQRRVSADHTLGEGDQGTSSSGDKRTGGSLKSDSPLKKMQVEGPSGEIRAVPVVTVASADANTRDYIPLLSLRESVITYLVRFACTPVNLNDVVQKKLAQRVLELIKEFLQPQFWADVHVKFSHLERTLIFSEISELFIPCICNALEILNIDIEHKPKEWIMLNLSQLYRLLEPSIKSDNVRIQKALNPVLVHIYKAIDESPDKEASDKDSPNTDVAALTSLVDSTITDGLQNLSNTYSVLMLLQAASSSRPEILDQFMAGIIKLIQKLTKEHVTPPSTPIQPSSSGLDSPVNLLIMSLRLVKLRVSHLGDQRRWYLTSLIQLIERSSDVELGRAILDMVTEWVLGKTETFPTIKEKAGLMVKMMSFENKSDKELTEDFLKLVNKIYNDPSFARSELTVRLEQAFLMGTRSDNPQIRNQFADIFDRSINKSLYSRLNYILGIQNWEFLATHFWIHQAADVLLGVVSPARQLMPSALSLTVKPLKSVVSLADEDTSAKRLKGEFKELISRHQAFLNDLQGMQTTDIITPLRQLHHLDDSVAYKMWIDIFPLCWSVLNNKERHDLTKVIIALLAKEYHSKQVDQRPNVIQALLEGIIKSAPMIKLPPHLVKYLGKMYNAWHIALEILQQAIPNGRPNDISASKDDQSVRERTLDALGELYATLSEDDMFYGLWRRRCIYSETNVAISCEQNGMWGQAQLMYENAQIKARSGVLPFTESEYLLWEDHWILCTQKLQQWDILTDLAKHDTNTDLLLECAWRLSDWTNERELLEQSIQQLADAPTPRRRVFEAFMALVKSQQNNEKLTEFSKICEEGIQLSLRKWHSLPSIVSQSHLPLLQIFQQYVELQEASQIFQSLTTTTAQNLDVRSQDLKGILTTWRERLPNMWDDINVWSDLVAWRQHIFSAINRTYLPLIPLLNQPAAGGNTGNTNSFAYRGYHETAWIINRFAKTARKHQLYDVCINYLTKIYTLPNIEIQEAFLKLREQAKCYYQNATELNAGLDVINNTNLVYFSHQQKAEFFTLKGMFLAKLNLYNEANDAFVSAVQIDLSLAKAWAAWGHYNDQRFKENLKDTSWAANAVSCYLQAAGIYKNTKSRKYLIRVLWLLSLDDAQQNISHAFENYKGDVPVWYWITFIPQLLTSLQHKEARHARAMLARIAKQYPQALHFQLRTQKEDYTLMKKQGATLGSGASTPATPTSATPSAASGVAANATPSNSGNVLPPTPTTASPVANGPSSSSNGTTSAANAGDAANIIANGSVANDQTQRSQAQSLNTTTQPSVNGQTITTTPGIQTVAQTLSNTVPTQSPTQGAAATLAVTPQNGPQNPPSGATGAAGQTPQMLQPGQIPQMQRPVSNINTNQASPQLPRQPWELVEEIMSTLKTNYPLLALSMETMIDGIQQKLKPVADEDMYRLIVALLNDGVQQLLARLTSPADKGLLTPATEANIVRFADNLYAGQMKTAFINDFINAKPNLAEYVAKLRMWRDKFEAVLDSRPRRQHLELLSHYLVEFQHQKFDDVEIPGQYLLLKDNANDFLRIDRFLPEVEIIRGYGSCFRRITIRGHDGSLHPFIVQHPAARHGRREERIMQLFRILNRCSLTICATPSFRSVLERHKESRMRNLNFHLPVIIPLAPHVRLVEDDPSYCSLQEVYEDHCDNASIHKDDPITFFIDKIRSNLDLKRGTELLNLRMEIGDEIAAKMVPPTILTKYMLKSMSSYTDFWMIRKQFTTQLASTTFMTYIMSVAHRQPYKFFISRNNGNIWMTELLPVWSQNGPVFATGESVPFRLTPNIQNFITPVGVEGMFTSSLMAVARCLTEPEFELDQYLSIFIRDELVTWHSINHKPANDQQLREHVARNVDYVLKKTQFLSCKMEREKVKAVNSNTPVNQSIIDLISQAGNPQKLAQMECTWMPWL